MSKRTAQVDAQRDRLVAWIDGKDEVRDLILSGVARNLYGQVVADLALQYLDQIVEVETDNLLDMALDLGAQEPGMGVDRMSIIAPVIHSSKFKVNVTGRSIVAEASDLRGVNFLAQAFDDACDIGFVVLSARTGREVLFTLTEQMKDREGDVVGWEFESYRIQPPIRAVIFND